MPAVAAVSIHDDFSARKPGVTHGSSDNESARGIDMELGAGVEQGGRHDVLDHFLYDTLMDFPVGYGVAVLRGDHHAIDACRAIVDVFDGDLRFAIGPQKR